MERVHADGRALVYNGGEPSDVLCTMSRNHHDKKWLEMLCVFCKGLEEQARDGGEELFQPLPREFASLTVYRHGIDWENNKSAILDALSSARRTLKVLHGREIMAFSTDKHHRPGFEKPLLHALTLGVEHNIAND